MLSAVLGNLHSYYQQFLPAIEASITAGLAPHEKDLSDFVTLAKWEDRGFYAMKAAAEKAQRHLHRLSRRATVALKEPSASTLAAAAKNMGMNDLAAPENVGYVSSQELSAGVSTATLQVNSKEALSALGAAATSVGEVSCRVMESGKYTSQLPKLTVRFTSIASRAVGGRSEGVDISPVLFADRLASDAAQRAVQLRGDVAKGAKARKKKALVDFFKMLSDCGISKLRSAIPLDKRGIQACFLQVGCCHPS